MNWTELLEYKDGDLYWKVKPHRKANAGDKAGTKQPTGYIQICLNGTLTVAHRIVWWLHNKTIPDGYEIDHINHIHDDNRIENLRLVTKLENRRNKAKQRNNSSGVNGVYWHTSNKKWAACINIEGKAKHLGCFPNKEAAIAARQEADILYGFHANHGM